ncbi:MAG: hypothetical protein AAGF74_07260 [Pseudomonadota bacterium]
MKKLIAAAVVATVTVGSASAQTANELYKEGSMDSLTMVESQILGILADNGVPASCLGQMSLSDIAILKGILDNGDLSDGDKRNRAKAVVQRVCGL